MLVGDINTDIFSQCSLRVVNKFLFNEYCLEYYSLQIKTWVMCYCAVLCKLYLWQR